jgi:hypothetical protein
VACQASLAKTLTSRSAGIPVATRFMLRRDHRRAHKANGNTVKVPAGTGGTLREERLLDELYMNSSRSVPHSPHHPLKHAGGPLGTGMVRRRGVLAPHLGLGPQMGFGRQSNRKLRVWENPRRNVGERPAAPEM